MARSTDYREDLFKRIRQREDGGAGLLDMALREDIPTFLMALKDIVDAKTGITGLSSKTELSRVSLHAALSDKGNPKLSNLAKVLDALGLRLSVNLKEKKGRKAKAG